MCSSTPEVHLLDTCVNLRTLFTKRLTNVHCSVWHSLNKVIWLFYCNLSGFVWKQILVQYSWERVCSDCINVVSARCAPAVYDVWYSVPKLWFPRWNSFLLDPIKTQNKKCSGSSQTQDLQYLNAFCGSNTRGCGFDSSQVKLSFIIIPLHVCTYSGTKRRVSQNHGAT